MTTSGYMLGRKKYSRPQALLFADNPGTLVTGDDDETYLVPQGYEIRSEALGPTTDLNQFMILSDHNRSEINISSERIGRRDRMINGNLRSYHIADKMKISVSYDMLPSRAYASNAAFDIETGQSIIPDKRQHFTVDGGAGGVELLEWYENHKGSFWVYLSYDKYNEFNVNNLDSYLQLKKYIQVVEVEFSDFSYSVVKRSKDFDFWNIDFSLEEV